MIKVMDSQLVDGSTTEDPSDNEVAAYLSPIALKKSTLNNDEPVNSDNYSSEENSATYRCRGDSKCEMYSNMKQKEIFAQAVHDLLKLQAERRKSKSRYGLIQSIIEKYNNLGYDFVTRRTLTYRLNVYKRDHPYAFIKSEDCDDDLSFSLIPSSHKTTRKWRQFHSKASQAEHTTLIEATSKSDKLRSIEGKSTRQIDAKVEREIVHKIGKDVEKQYERPENAIATGTIRSRGNKNNVEREASQRVSPLVNLEPQIVIYCQRVINTGSLLLKSQIISIAERLLELSKFKNPFNNKTFTSGSNDCVSDSAGHLAGWWDGGFINRNRQKIKEGLEYLRDIRTQTWFTFRLFEDLYASTYESMVSAGVAERLPFEVNFDKEGNEAQISEDAVGRPSKYKLKRPDKFLYLDVTGSRKTLDQEDHFEDQRFVLPLDDPSPLDKLYFTVSCFYTGTGDPVVCAVIFQVEQVVSNLPISWKFGVDVTKPLHPGENDHDFYSKNCAKGQAMQGGPKCVINGKEIPCYIGTSPKGVISSIHLLEILQMLDEYKVFDRSDSVKPFLLLDGYRNQMDVSFLDYIYGQGHEWTVCVGIPFGTHQWQVPDSSHLNEAFKVSFWKARTKLQKLKRINGKKLAPTDVIPLINYAWPESYANNELVKEAMFRHGWRPLNYALLEHPHVQEMQALYLESLNTSKIANFTEKNTESFHENDKKST